MGRRLNISQPAVIQTELRPLDESFWIDANGGFEQWYYQNTNVFAPDRQITPLILSPHLSAIDRDTNTAYTPNFQLDHWEVKEYIDGAWVTTVITNQSQNENYVVQGLNLIVKKNNYDATHAINITCKATYQDPRDVGVLCKVQDSVMLVTSIDATQAFPKIDIVNPATRTYNPLKDESPVFEFEGKADWDGVEAQGGTAITECKVDPLGTEQILPTNDEMMLNAAPTLNTHYGDIEKSDQQFMYRQTANGEVSEIVGGVSAIDNIKGNTVAWNQLVQNGDFSNGTYGWQVTMDSSISASNNILTFTPTKRYANIRSVNITTIQGHKYFFKYYAKSATSISFWKAYIGNTSSIGTTTTEWSEFSDVLTASSSDQAQFVRFQDNTGTVTQVKNVILIDLTLMFGAGNEPDTVAEFETWLATNVGLKKYYEYCSGKLVNFGGFGVKWNQLIKNGDFSEGTNEWDAVLGTISSNNNVLAYTVNTVGQNSWDNRIRQFGINLKKEHTIYISFDSKVAHPKNIWLYFITQSEIGYNPVYSVNVSTTSWTTNSLIVTLPSYFLSEQGEIQIGLNTVVGYSVGDIDYIRNFQIIDLTEMFGAGNEPTLEWCNKYFSKDYYPYCPSVEKNILDVMTTKESGFNIWDEEWELGNIQDGILVPSGENVRAKNYIEIKPNTEYYCVCGGDGGDFHIWSYDENKNPIEVSVYRNSRTSFITPSNAKYLMFCMWASYGSTYNHDICINVSDSLRNGDYEPYHAQYKAPEMGIKTTGFNQWDEEWEVGILDVISGQKGSNNDFIRTKNFNKVLPNTDYYYRVPNSIGANNINIFYYDENKDYIGYVSNTNSVKKTPSNCCYIMFYLDNVYGTTYNHDICINISNPSKNGTYEPYWESKSDMSWITKIGIENFNIWDEEWELGDLNDQGQEVVQTTMWRNKGYIPIEPLTTYFFNNGGGGNNDAFFYDANKNFISGSVIRSTNLKNQTFTTPSAAVYMRFYNTAQTSYQNNICINKSIPTYNGRYVPHGETAPYFPNGLCKAGDVYDEVKVENGKIKGVVRLGSIDLGDLDWVKDTTTEGGQTIHAGLTPSPLSYLNIKPYAKYAVNNIVCSRYKSYNYPSIDFGGEDKTVAIDDFPRVWVWDSAYNTTDATAFKEMLKGVQLIYELETPYEFEIDYPTKGQFMWYGVNSSGSEIPIDQLPIYSQATQPSGYGQGTSRININALYGENIPVILRVKRYPWSPNVLPPKVTKSVAWSIPPIDVVTTCDKGSAVRATNSSENFIFGTIVNQQGDVISEEKKAENMVFDWYMVKYGTSGAIKTPYGSGLTKSIPASSLKNTTPSGGVTPSTNVYCEAFLLGAYHLVDGQYVRTKD